MVVDTQLKFMSKKTFVFRHSVFPFMLFIGVLFIFTSFLFPIEFNPDYEAYKWIYENDAINYAQASVDLLFVGFVRAVRYFNIEYEYFRYALLIISLAALYFAIIFMHKSLSYHTPNRDSIRLKITPLLLVVVIVSMYMLFLEFYLVRIRAGFALSIIALSFVFYLTDTERAGIIKKSAALVLLVISYNIHSSTTIVLGYMFFIPFFYLYLYNNIRTFLSKNISLFFVVCTSVLISLLIIYAGDVKSVARGAHLFSHLHPARIFGVAMIPLLLPVAIEFLRACLAKETSKIRFTRSKNNCNCDLMLTRARSWLNFSTLTYLSLALSLIILFGVGFVETSGEAMVRFFTLSSVPAVFVLLIGRSKYSLIWQYILLINSLFFAKAIFTPFL